MPTPIRTALVAACALAAMTALAAPAAARTVPVDLRVLTVKGKLLAEQRQYTGATAVRTDPGADCFGSGTGGSGKVARIPAATALGTLVDAAPTDADLRPLSITDYDFGFPGLGLCGIGRERAQGSQFWFLKVNRRNPQMAGDQVRVSGGDSVVWYLIPFTKCDPNPPYHCPPELVLQAPARAQPGVPFTVRVRRFNDAGQVSPAAGVRVDGAMQRTDASGRTTVLLAQSRRIRAVRPGSIPSAPVPVCVSAELRGCPALRALTIRGSARRDVIRGTRRPDRVRARGGADRVNVRGGGRDTVNCGRGRDTVILGKGDRARACERKIRKG